MQPEVLPTKSDYQPTQISKMPHPNIYIQMLPEYKGWIFLEEEARSLKGRWAGVFGDPQLPVDLEIGCGNGFFFEHQIQKQPERNLLGIEIKYKPLVQTVRRAKKRGLQNARGIRYNARFVDQIFAPEEIHNIFIYHPDPWPKKRQQKNRLFRREFLETLFKLQRPGCFVDIKTDDLDYFNFMEEEAKNCSYKMIRFSRDLHHSEWESENFKTAFEKIFLSKGQPIYYMRLLKAE